MSDTVSSTGIDESIILTSKATASSFAFRLSGAVARPDSSGGLDVVAAGRLVGSIPPVTVTTATPLTPGGHRPGSVQPDLTAASGARITTSGTTVTVSVSQSWLAALPASAFPVVIDPGFETSGGLTKEVSLGSGGQVKTGTLQIGTDSSNVTWRAGALFTAPTLPAPMPGAPPWQLFTADFGTFSTSTVWLSDFRVYGESTAPSATPTYSSITSGTLIFDYAEPGPCCSGADVTSFINGKSSFWIGRTGTGSLVPLEVSNTYIIWEYAEAPPPTTIISPANSATLSTTTPTLTAQVTDTIDNGSGATGSFGAVEYDFKLSTAPGGAGTAADSGWITQNSWTVPPGTLHNGVTYYASVLDDIGQPWEDPSTEGYIPPAAAGPAISFQIAQRLGGGGPSPTDTVGATPNGTTTPSAGTPSLDLSTGSETVDLVTGNLSIAATTHSLPTVSGPAGVTLSYNSSTSSVSGGGNYGLTGQYYPDSGGHTFTGTLTGQRVDSGIDATWGSGPPIGGFIAWQPFMVRWTGILTLPAGTWHLGGITTGAMRIYLNGSSTPTYNDWAGAAGTGSPSYGTATVSGGQQYKVEVDDWEPNQTGHAGIQLWALDTAISSSTQQSAFIVPSNWLTPAATGLPPGWSLSANMASAVWTHADDEGSQVVLTAVTGDTATFTRAASGAYQPPPGDQDFLSVNGNGRLQLSTTNGYLYTFNPDGTLASMTTVTDDRHPASLQYTYGGSPAVLRGITDPVSGRTISLYYGGDSACPTSSLGGYASAPGMLCEISYWDGLQTTFLYNANGQLALMQNPGGEMSLFGYDSDNKLNEIRDPLNSDFINGQSSNDLGPNVDPNCSTVVLSQDCSEDTIITYDSQGRVATVQQPSTTGWSAADRPGRTYTYGSGSTSVAIAGFTPASGYAQTVFYDSRGRITKQLNSAELATSTAWDGLNRAIATVDPAGEQTSTVYDANGNVTDKYGPAPVACFSGGWPAASPRRGRRSSATCRSPARRILQVAASRRCRTPIPAMTRASPASRRRTGPTGCLPARRRCTAPARAAPSRHPSAARASGLAAPCAPSGRRDRHRLAATRPAPGASG